MQTAAWRIARMVAPKVDGLGPLSEWLQIYKNIVKGQEISFHYKVEGKSTDKLA